MDLYQTILKAEKIEKIAKVLSADLAWHVKYPKDWVYERQLNDAVTLAMIELNASRQEIMDLAISYKKPSKRK